jgi:hypothetical protein
MVEFLVTRIQAFFNISQAFPVRKLGIGKAEKLIIAGKPFGPVIGFVFLANLSNFWRGRCSRICAKTVSRNSSATLPLSG